MSITNSGSKSRRSRRKKDKNNGDQLAIRVEALEQAAALGADRLDPEAIAFAEAIVAKATERLRHGSSHLLVALLGATGSGKSSLCNAITGSEVATTGVRRPTTSSTLACVWGSVDADSLLDWLGVSTRHQVANDGSSPDYETLEGLVLLDVPDHDSVEVSHQLEMEQIAEHADLLIWITDPEKYADAALHHYLRRLSHHGAAMVLVLNKSDQLANQEFAACRDDLVRLLGTDGVEGTPVIATSAVIPGGADDLRGLLIGRVQGHTSIMTRLEADIAVAATDLLADATQSEDQRGSRRTFGPHPKKRLPSSPGVSKQIASTLSKDLTEAVGIETVRDAVVSGYRRDAMARTGWPFTRWTRRLRPHPLRRLHLEAGTGGRSSRPPASAAQRTRALASVRDAADAASLGLDAPWPRLIRQAGSPEESVLFDRLDLAVSGAVREVRPRKPTWWKLVGLLQVLLALAVIVGAVWLIGLAGAAWLQLPALPTPTVRRIPIPTGLLIGGALLGWLISALAGRLAAVGARRAGQSVTDDIAAAVEEVASELILDPIKKELTDRDTLIGLLQTASSN